MRDVDGFETEMNSSYSVLLSLNFKPNSDLKPNSSWKSLNEIPKSNDFVYLRIKKQFRRVNCIYDQAPYLACFYDNEWRYRQEDSSAVRKDQFTVLNKNHRNFEGFEWMYIPE